MTLILKNLIRSAKLSITEDDEETEIFLHQGHRWVTDGGRSCPLNWDDCSQPVYRIADTEIYDYGQKGGPGDKTCRDHCHHHYQPPPVEEDEAVNNQQPDLFTV